MFTPGKKMKLIFLIEFSSLETENGRIFAELVNKLSKIFKDNLLRIACSCFFIVSKVREYSIEDILEMVKDSCESQKYKMTNQ